MHRPPHEEAPGELVPEAADDERDGDRSDRYAQGPPASGAAEDGQLQRNEEVAPDEAGERDMPSFPEHDEVAGTQRRREVFRSGEAQEYSCTHRDV